MVPSGFYLEAPRRLRALVRARESTLIVIAALIGAISGLLVAAMSAAVEVLHVALFNIPIGARLSGQTSIDPVRAIAVPALGGLVLGLALLVLLRWRPGREIDPIEANALHGGYMSFRGSIIVALQTIWSSGVGGSVGLEAGYTQLASGVASSVGRGFHLRRVDQRVMVGCGAAAAIAGAFGAPLAGSFYAFELVLGSYAPASLAPIGIAAVTGYAVTHAFAPLSLGIVVRQVGEVMGQDLAIACVLGLLAALTGIAIMRGVALFDTLLSKINLWSPLRPALGGFIVGLMALITPQVLASGHGALHVNSMIVLPVTTIAIIFVLKAFASIVSLGSGFRGGLFFASLLLGSLGGHLFAAGLSVVFPHLNFDPNVYAIIGMSALSASIIGGPLTMSFIALEATGNFWLTTAVLIAVIISMQVTRELFGYSFATWRFHLRGETIRSAADVGWIRDLTVKTMMRADAVTVDADMPINDFIAKFPLGSKTQVVGIDASGSYAGVIFVAEAQGLKDTPGAGVKDILRYRDATLSPEMNVKQAVAAFDAAEAESLAVVDSAHQRRVIGILTEAHTLRRYAEEFDKHRRDVLGEI
ncbi:chloride channel protein [Bradyrhizobium sp. SYSU BS000235]|uniref:chloride channel protein n=1 Tax=Bradyrhizobium sp. SYSU BS000235 TaxID=3411332 RepID=UPI003C779511